jgi:hypothetical protein
MLRTSVTMTLVIGNSRRQVRTFVAAEFRTTGPLSSPLGLSLETGLP